MAAKRKKDVQPAALPPAEVPGADRIVLTDAYKAGLIQAWKLDSARGYCLTRTGRADEYIEVGQLTRYLDNLRRIA